MKKLLLISTIGLGFAAWTLQAENSEFFQASLTPDMAVESKTTLIEGLSLNIWGENPQHGLTLGFVNGSTGESSGFSWGLVNYSESYNGVSWGLANLNLNGYNGWQSGWVNICKKDFVGLQSAWILNYAQNMTGLQVGLVNYSEHLNGVQIGLANIAENNEWFDAFPNQLAKGFPILNWSF